MHLQLRTLSAAFYVIVFLGPNSTSQVDLLVPDLTQFWSKLTLHLFGVGLDAECLQSHKHALWHHGGVQSPVWPGWYSFLLLRFLAVLLLLSTTSCVTRNGATVKLVSALTDKLAAAFRVALQLAICADVLGNFSSSGSPGQFSTGFWGPAAAAAESATDKAAYCDVGPAAALQFSPRHLVTSGFLLNQLVLFSQDPCRDLWAGVLELLLLSINLSVSSNTCYQLSSCSCCWQAATTHNRHVSPTSLQLAGQTCSATPPSTTTSSSSSSSTANGVMCSTSSNLPSLLLLAVISRLLLPLLAARLQVLLHRHMHSSTTSTSGSSSSGNVGPARAELLVQAAPDPPPAR